MNAIKTGCCGFPVAQGKYYKTLNTIEVNQSFFQLPELKTAHKWAAQAPKGFEFIIKAWQLITHPCINSDYKRLTEKIPESKRRYYGNFSQTEEVMEAWRRTFEFGNILGAKIYLFQTPGSFRPNVDNITNLYKFFKAVNHGKLTFVWENKANWPHDTVIKICKDLNLVHCVDPFKEKSLAGHIRYYRLHGDYQEKRIVFDYKYTLKELDSILKFADKPLNYFLFDNSTMWADCLQFQNLIKKS
jgi:uncharacterized protein YecE (DUF72 family)